MMLIKYNVVNNMDEQINWNEFSKYWSPSINTEVTVILSNWKQLIKTFRGNDKLILSFLVHQIEDEVYNPPLEYNTSGSNALQFRKVIESAELRKAEHIMVRIRCSGDKKIQVADMILVNKIISKR